jgi:hypothetical protein
MDVLKDKVYCQVIYIQSVIIKNCYYKPTFAKNTKLTESLIKEVSTGKSRVERVKFWHQRKPFVHGYYI